MRVLILGGGTVGREVAKRLCAQNYDVTVVEQDAESASELDDELDARVLCGNATQASVLFLAEATTADVAFALTGNDSTNLVASRVCKAMGSRRVIARVFSPELRSSISFDYRRFFDIDRLLSIEYLTAVELTRRIREPGAMMTEHFACGSLEMQEVVVANKKSKLTNRPLRDLKLPSEVRVGAITRGDHIAIATATDRILPGDRVTLIGSREHVEGVKSQLISRRTSRQDVVIVGGGEIGLNVASVLEARNYCVKIVERNEARCDFLSSRLKKSTIICGDGRRKSLLDEQNVGVADAFIACAGDDEYNILSCVEARELGAKTSLAVVSNPDYASVVGKLGIDEAVSPFAVVGRQAEGLARKGALIFQNSALLSGPVEVLELEVASESAVTFAPLKDLKFPRPTLLAAVIRENAVLTPSASFEFRAKDQVVALTMVENIPDVVGLFESKRR